MDYADEAGLLIQNEFFIWTGHGTPEPWRQWDTHELIGEFKEYMRDNWNHPSQAIWDAANETEADVLGEKVIPAVRGLDLSNRAWENGYNLPSGPDDPVEDHPYLFNKPAFQMSDLEKMTGGRSTNSGHPTRARRLHQRIRLGVVESRRHADAAYRERLQAPVGRRRDARKTLPLQRVLAGWTD